MWPKRNSRERHCIQVRPFPQSKDWFIVDALVPHGTQGNEMAHDGVSWSVSETVCRTETPDLLEKPVAIKQTSTRG